MKKPFWICPSILSANVARLAEEVQAVTDAGADRLHVDVMDNHYVPNLTFGPLVCAALKQEGITLPMDVHLMVKPVDRLIEAFAQAGASSITIHPEATEHVDRSLALIKSFDIDAGLALNPATGVQALQHVHQHLDRVLVMTVNPGFGGQSFIPDMLDKIQDVSAYLTSVHSPARLEVDGGINLDTIADAAKCGADAFVTGSYLFRQKDYANAIDALRKRLSLDGGNI